MAYLPLLWDALLLGIGATLFMDLAGVAQHLLLRSPLPDYRFVGRWAAYLRQGRWRHALLFNSPPKAHEKVIGWALHYVTGVVFALLLLLWQGRSWLQAPELGSALMVGVATVLVPWCLMQPAWGMGLAARHTPAPWTARRKSLVAHGWYGIGLWCSGSLLALS